MKKTACEVMPSLVGSEMCIRSRDPLPHAPGVRMTVVKTKLPQIKT